MTRVTAVVCAFWPTRHDNVRRIVADIQASSVVPDRVIVWNNGGSIEPPPTCEVIDAPANYECRGKFIAGLLDPSDYYLFMDDDTSVGRQTVECFMRFAHRGCVFGYWGVNLVTMPDGRRSFSNGAIVGPAHVGAPTRVDAFHGRGMFVAYDALVRTLQLEEKVRLGGRWPTEGDDLIIGLANESEVIPMRGDELFVDLTEGGVAMCHAPGYFEMRDDFLQDVLAAMSRA